MNIIRIKKEDRYFKEIVNTYYNWWAKKRNISYQDHINNYKNYLLTDEIPNIYALIINDTLVGMYELNEKDNIDEQNYTPYLANVFIKESYRNNNYSKLLIEDAIKRVEKMGYNKLYLHTKLENFYEKYNFQYSEEVKTKYGPKRIFVLHIKR